MVGVLSLNSYVIFEECFLCSLQCFGHSYQYSIKHMCIVLTSSLYYRAVESCLNILSGVVGKQLESFHY